MLINLAIEIPVAGLVLLLSHLLWPLLKSRSYVLGMLDNPNELTKLIDLIGIDSLRLDSEKLEPIFGSWIGNITFNFRIHFQALARLRNLFLVPTFAAVLGSSYLLGISFGIFNVAIALAMGIPRGSYSANRYNLDLLHTVLTNLYRWAHDDSDAAVRDCPSVLSTALTTIQHAIKTGVYQGEKTDHSAIHHLMQAAAFDRQFNDKFASFRGCPEGTHLEHR